MSNNISNNLRELIDKKNEDNKEVTLNDVFDLLVDLDNERKKIIVLTPDEIKDLKQMIADRQAIGRVWSLVKTLLLAVAGTLVAYSVVFDHIKAFLIWLANTPGGKP